MKKLSMINNQLSKRRGFTLVEFIVYTALFLVIIYFLLQFLLSILRNQIQSTTVEAVVSNTLHAVNSIDFEVRHAKQIYDPTSDFAASKGRLTLLSEHALPTDETETYVDIYVDSQDRLCIKRELSGVSCITSDNVRVTQLDFDKIQLSGGSAESGVHTHLTIEYKTPDANRAAPFSTESFTRLRNE